ncbi:hypothetical protein [Noviherbaspirillum sp.]|nr:hypothetical protein [Noviherbaspirillum sp.]HJV83737.1 hypothetical protein [Noviherbaspirillum sp.]
MQIDAPAVNRPVNVVQVNELPLFSMQIPGAMIAQSANCRSRSAHTI